MKFKTMASGAVVVAVLAGLPPDPAWAHAMLVKSVPENGALLAPKAIEPEFKHPARLTQVKSVRLAEATDPERPIPVAFDQSAPAAAHISVPLPAPGPGKYTIAWRALAGDGHVMSGKLSFTVSK